MPGIAAKPAGDKSLVKGLQVLEALAGSEGARGISELSRELSLTKSNVHRLLQSLVGCGYVSRDDATERYQLSAKLWRLTSFAPPLGSLRQQVRPILRNAVEKAGDNILLAAVASDELTIVDQVETNNAMRVYMSLGQSFRMDEIIIEGRGLTALQTVALAYHRSNGASGALTKRKKVGKSVVNEAILVQVRKDGYAASRGNWISDVNAVNVPVLTVGNQLIGVLSCFGPASRLTEARFPEVANILRGAAMQLAERIG